MTAHKMIIGQRMELDPLQKKQNHSLNERKRREKLKSLIGNLKMLVPKSKSQNLQQIAVLENAVEYIKKVQSVLRLHGLMDEEEDHIMKYQSQFYVGRTVSDPSDTASDSGASIGSQKLKELVPTSAKQESLQQLYILENAATYIKKVQQVLKANGLMIEEDASPSPVYSTSTFIE
ncbi:hypothetical protein HDV06_003015 [Boothiomyces sp. JEL0866]|nr:hypothetical protein HDV06_003015 [Boothiomyces sp. JEL0866]